MSSQLPEISAVIVSYGTRDVTLECLQRLAAELEGMAAEVWVVDNASPDDSAAVIERRYPDVRLIRNPTNAGFGAANNLALARAGGEFLLLINSDAFVRPGAIATLVKYLRQHPEVGVVGPRLLNGDGTLQPSCYRFPTPLRAWLENLWISALLSRHPRIGDYRRWNHDFEREVDSVSGACFLVRRSAYETVGGFDERFFMYSEETDWQRRIRGAGWKVAFTPAAEVTHLGGASGANEPARINRHFFNSLDYYEWKHHGPLGLVSLRVAMVIGCALRIVAWSCAAAVDRRRRLTTASKLRLYSWLIHRQITHWPRTPTL